VVGLAALCVVTALLAQVRIVGPRIHVRWRAGIGDAARAPLERRFHLRRGGPVDPSTNTWRYDLGDRSTSNVRALIEDAAVADTAYIDRRALAPLDGRTLQLDFWYPLKDLFPHPVGLLRLHRSLWLVLAGGVLLVAARSAARERRRNTAVLVLVLVGAVAMAVPLQPPFVRMGGSADHFSSRRVFEDWFANRVRFEKHLSQVGMWQLYRRLEPTEAAPQQALAVVTRAATAGFVAAALAVGALEQWSPLALRYLALAVLAPATLLYFGWRELGHLSLCAAAFPVFARGIRNGDAHLEAGSALTGLGAAFHGSGLVGLVGTWLAALFASGRWKDRAARTLRVLAWGTAAYLGWMVIYAVVMKLSIEPNVGAGAVNGWRPWSTDEMRLGRHAAAILSAIGARDLSMSAWIVGVPLVAVTASLGRRYPAEVRLAMCYLPPSLLFLIFRWPFDGIGSGMDLVAAGFPALYALAWVCAHDEKRANVAAALLVTAHYAFWRVVLDDRFEP
jgi:hypothetical protein